MRLIFCIISTLLVVLNLDAPPITSDAPALLLIIEHFCVILIAQKLVNKQLSGCYTCYRRRYFTFFLISYSVSLVLLYLYWTPYMKESWATNMDTFDPVKYYAIASEIVQGEMSTAIIAYPVSWIYVVVFSVLGRDPLIPLFLNSIAVLYAVLILAKSINCDNNKHVKYFSLLLLIPEVVYYNMMSAKDTICMICSVIIFVITQRLIDKKYCISDIFIIIIAFIAMVLARTSMSLVAVLGVIIGLLFSGKLTRKKILLFLFFGCVVGTAMGITIGLGAHESTFNVQEKIEGEMSGDMGVANTLEDQSKDSFMKYLVPSNPLEFVFFGIVRSFCYVIIDPGMITNPLAKFTFDGSFKCPIMPNLTTVLMFISLPVIFVGLMAWKKKNKEYKALYIQTLIYFFVVGAFNPLILHIRYRVVYDLLFFTLAIKSYLIIKEKKQRKQTSSPLLN